MGLVRKISWQAALQMMAHCIQHLLSSRKCNGRFFSLSSNTYRFNQHLWLPIFHRKRKTKKEKMSFIHWRSPKGPLLDLVWNSDTLPFERIRKRVHFHSKTSGKIVIYALRPSFIVENLTRKRKFGYDNLFHLSFLPKVEIRSQKQFQLDFFGGNLETNLGQPCIHLLVAECTLAISIYHCIEARSPQGTKSLSAS